MLTLIVNDPAWWLLMFAGIIVLNTIPAFMPPTWTLLAWAHINYDIPVVLIAAVGAVGAATGRVLLALGSRVLGMRIIPPRWRANIHTLLEEIRARPALSLGSLGLFALGPIPTNHLFIAVGLAGAPLKAVTAVFGVTRFISYILWVQAAQTAVSSLDDILKPALGGGAAIAAQLVGFALLIFVMQIDWATVLRRFRHAPDTPEPTEERR
jgi:hypothetical protein